MAQKLIFILFINLLIVASNAIEKLGGWEQAKYISVDKCHFRAVQELQECQTLAVEKYAIFISYFEKRCEFCYEFNYSDSESSTILVYIPNQKEDLKLEYILPKVDHYIPQSKRSYISRVIIDSINYKFAVFSCFMNQADSCIKCFLKGFFTKHSDGNYYKYERFDGQVQFKIEKHFYDTKSKYSNLNDLSLTRMYVADYFPQIPGKSILELMVRLKQKFGISSLLLEDASNIQLLSLLAYGTTYYQSHNYQYTKDNWKKNCKSIEYQRALLEKIPTKEIKLDEIKKYIEKKFEAKKVPLKEKVNFLDLIDQYSETSSMEIKQLYKMNKKILNSIDIQKIQDANEKKILRSMKKNFSIYLGECIYNQIEYHLSDEQKQCINSIIEELNPMKWIEPRTKNFGLLIMMGMGIAVGVYLYWWKIM